MAKLVPLGMTHYTPEEDSYLRKNFLNLTDQQLADGLADLGFKRRTPEQIHWRLNHLLLNRRAVITDRTNEIRRMAEKEHLNATEIAQELGNIVSPAAVRSFCRKYGIKVERKPRPRKKST